MLQFADKASLFTPSGGAGVGADWGHFGMCPMLKNLLLIRWDVAQTFDLNTPGGLADAIAWMFVRALPEYAMVDLVDPATVQALNAPVSYYPAAPNTTGEVIQGPAAVELSVLMGLVWRHRLDVQAHFDIGTAVGRAQFCLWFVAHGVSEMGLQNLVNPSRRAWLMGVVPGSFAPKLPRLGVIAWLARPDLQAAFDLNSAAGVDRLAAWTQHSLQSEPSWQWLATPGQTAPESDTPSSRWLPQPVPEFGVNLIGFARGELGIGEDVRMAVAACEAAGLPYSLVNISTGSNTRQGDSALAVSLQRVSAAPYSINIFCLTGFDTARVFFEQGATLFANRYNIGWWPWELPVWPEQWRVAFDLVDEVWAATEFTRKMYSVASPKPTFLMPLPASVARVEKLTRRKVGLPTGPFLFLYIFDFNSYLVRKNPLAALDAFAKAFAPDDESVGLVLKTMNSDSENPQWKRFLRACAKDKRVTLLDKTLDRGEVLGLVQACDAYVSLHRSEGFGRTLAEAMLFGKPVVGTDFSGNVDFLTVETGFPVKWKKRAVGPGEYPFVTKSDKAWWAEPDVMDGARQMRAAREAAQVKAFESRVRQFALEQFSPQRIGALMMKRLLQVSTGNVRRQTP